MSGLSSGPIPDPHVPPSHPNRRVKQLPLKLQSNRQPQIEHIIWGRRAAQTPLWWWPCFGWCLVCDFSITVQPVSALFTVLKRTVQVIHCLFLSYWTFVFNDSEMGLKLTYSRLRSLRIADSDFLEIYWSSQFSHLQHDRREKFTGNDITSYFRSAANRTNVSILSLIDNGSTAFKGRMIQVLDLLLYKGQVCAPWPRKWNPNGRAVVCASHCWLAACCFRVQVAHICWFRNKW